MFRAISIEREYASGGPEIAFRIAVRLGWVLWDQSLTAEIARLVKCSTEIVEKLEWHRDPLAYRLFKAFVCGGFEGNMRPVSQLELLDAERIARITKRLVQNAAEAGNCVIVGRGAQYFLKNREDVLRIFLYAPRDEKVKRLMAQNKSHEEASELVDIIDRERAAFIKKYFQLPWPDRSLYHAMFNTAMGNERVVAAILNFIHVPAHVV
jgi:hypothetical protein